MHATGWDVVLSSECSGVRAREVKWKKVETSDGRMKGMEGLGTECVRGGVSKKDA